MANPEHLAVIKKGADEWNKWREGAPDVVPDLAWADISGLVLDGANLAGAKMKLAFCKGTSFKNADFTGANLYGANLEKTELGGAKMRDCNLEGAHLIGSNIGEADTGGANMRLARTEGHQY